MNELLVLALLIMLWLKFIVNTLRIINEIGDDEDQS